MMTGRHAQGIAQMRAALKERPTYLLLWNLMIGFSLHREQENNPLAEELLHEALKTSDTPRNRILLAKVYQNTGRQKEKAEQVELDLKKDGNNLLAILSAATLALQRGDDKSIMETARFLDQVERLPATEMNADLYAVYEILRGVHLVLTGKKNEGMECIQAVANADKENEQARDLLMALKP